MITIFDNVLSPEEADQLLTWYKLEDNLIEDRLNHKRKTPIFGNTNWPQNLQNLVKKILDCVHEDSYEVEYVLFYGSQISFRLHVDSGSGDGRQLYKNVLIPLYHDGAASTVIFDNHWHGKGTNFSRINVLPFEYSLPDKFGSIKRIPDIRVLLRQCINTPESITDFVVDKNFILSLKKLVLKQTDKYINDYHDVVNYKPDLVFPQHLHEQYLNHVPIENLHGLTVEKIIPWKVGQAITFDRTHLHCAGSGHKLKIGITVFTYKK